jgi:hypothetical protein
MSSPLHGIGPRKRRSRFQKKRGCHEYTLSPSVLWSCLLLLWVAVDASLALKAIDRLAQSEGYIQSVMTLTDGPIH